MSVAELIRYLKKQGIKFKFVFWLSSGASVLRKTTRHTAIIAAMASMQAIDMIIIRFFILFTSNFC